MQPLFAPPTPVVVGHRGAPVEAPENTPASFAAAATAGARWVELDARLAGDGTVVVSHDPVLSDGRPLIELSASACMAAGVWPLAEVLTRLPAHLGIDLEIKNVPGEPDHDPGVAVVAACQAVLAADDADRPVVISSFNPLVLMALDDIGDDRPRALVTLGAAMTIGVETAVELGARGLFCHDRTDDLDAAGVAAAHDEGLAVMVWTVDDVPRACALAELGVDALCTNDPRALTAAAARGLLRRSG